MALSEQTQNKVERWIEIYARIGYAAKGLVYGIVGLLALMESFDFASGETVGSEGVLKRIVQQPFGRTFLFILAVSLVGYVVWRFIQAALDPEHNNSTDKADLLRRFSYACSGVAYIGLAYSAVKILQVSSSEEGKTAQDWALDTMRQPLGRCLVGGVGLVIFGIGCYYFYRAIKAEFRKKLKRHHMSDAAKTWSMVVGRAGIAARGFVYAVIGCYTMRAAWEFDPSMIKTTEDALAVFNDNPTDELILAVLGIGFIAYGIHMGFQAAYRRIEPL
ncbi:MAG: DUF1206 domain-containing protein [Cyanobacteria bacterium J06554_3]